MILVEDRALVVAPKNDAHVYARDYEKIKIARQVA